MAPLCLLRGALRTTPRLSQRCPPPALLCCPWRGPPPAMGTPPGLPGSGLLPRGQGRPAGSGRGVRAPLGPPPVPSGLSPCPATRSWRGSVWRGHALAGMMAIPHRVENLWTN